MYSLRNELEQIKEKVPREKRLIANISDDSIENYCAVVETLDSVTNAFELNNCFHSPGNERLDFYDNPSVAEELFKEVKKCTGRPIALKLRPGAEYMSVQKERIIPDTLDSGITILNFGNTQVVEESRFSSGIGGISGSVLYENTLKNIIELEREFREYADIIATGGINSPEKTRESLMHAKTVGILTGFAGDPLIAKRINDYLHKMVMVT